MIISVILYNSFAFYARQFSLPEQVRSERKMRGGILKLFPCVTATGHFAKLAAVLLFFAASGIMQSKAGTWYSPEPPPSDKPGLAILIDGNFMWVGYADYGLVKYDEYGQIKATYTDREKLPSRTVTALAKQHNSLWIGTPDGLACLHSSGNMKVYTTDQGLPDNGITCLAVRGQTLYAGTMKGLVKHTGESFAFIGEEQGLPGLHITALAPYPDGLIIGTTQGWGQLIGERVYAHTQAGDGLPFEWITSAAFFKHRSLLSVERSSSDENWIVLGTAGGGLIYYNDKKYTSLGENEEFGDNWVTCIKYEPIAHMLWVGTHSGISIGNINEGTWERRTEEGGGLISNSIHAIDVKLTDEPYKDYEMLLGHGRCPGAEAINQFIASHSYDIIKKKNTSQDQSTAGSGGDPETAEAQASGTVQCEQLICNCPLGKPCKVCHAKPERMDPIILHVYYTWAGIGTAAGSVLYYEKELPHYGQGHIYSYLTNKGWEIKGIGTGVHVFAGVYPPGLGEGFLFYFDRPHVRFVPGWANPPDAQFSTQINSFGVTVDGYPLAGGYSLGRGGIAILDMLKADSSSLQNPWLIYGRDQGLTDCNVTCIFREGATILVGTGLLGQAGSVFRFKNGVFEAFPKDGLPYANDARMFRGVVTSLWGNREKAYVGTRGDGYYYFDGVTWTRTDTFSMKLSDMDVQAITYRDNVLYVGTKKGLDCISPNDYMHIDITQTTAGTNNVQALLWDDSEGDQDKLILWIGYEDGFGRFSTFKGDMVHGGQGHSSSSDNAMLWPGNPPCKERIVAHHWVGNPQHEKPDVCPFDGLPGNRVTSLAYDDINLWIGTDNGICRFRK